MAGEALVDEPDLQVALERTRPSWPRDACHVCGGEDSRAGIAGQPVCRRCRGHLERSPAAGVRPPRQARAEVVIPSSAEVARSLAEVKVPAHRVAFALAAACGLRRGELLGLRFDDLDLERGRLRVRRSYNRHGLTEPKSAASRRTVVVPRELVDQLVDLQAAAAEHGEPGFVLPGRDGGPTEPEVLDRAWRQAQARARVVHRTIHALRHHAISTWIAAGLSVKVVQVMAGHASATITLDRYGYLFPDDLELAAARLAEVDAIRAARTDAGPTRGAGTGEGAEAVDEKRPAHEAVAQRARRPP